MNESLAAECAACASCALSAPRGGPVPYEVHVTVAEADVGSFRAACASLGVKPLLLALQLAAGGAARDVMTSAVHLGDDAGAMAEARRTAEGLAAAGFEVTRVKVETAPWHPAAPCREGQSPGPGQYFESHLAVRCRPERRPDLSRAAAALGLHLSRNAFKGPDASGEEVVMATARSREGTAQAFAARAEAAKASLADAGFRVDKTIVEFALHDSRAQLDDAWLGLSQSERREAA